MSDKCRPFPPVKDCEPLRTVSPTLSPVGNCPADDIKPYIQPYLPSVSKFSHSNTYYNNARKGIYRRFSKCDWDSAYESNKHKADVERRHGQMCRADGSGTIRLTDGVKMLQCDNTKRLGDRAYNISYWKGELIMEMNLMEKETIDLEDMRQLVKKVLEDVEADLLLSEQCLLERERRIGVDQVRDEVERHLSAEVMLMRGEIERMHAMLKRINIQLKLNRAALNDVDVDGRNKHHAQQIDERMHRLNVETVELALHEGIEYQDNTETNTKTWLKYTKENLCRCQGERQRSSLVRAQAERLLRKVALDTWNCVQTVNRKYAVRIMETRDAYHKLMQHAERVHREKVDMENNIEALKQAIIEKERLMKVTQTRLEERLRRLGAEKCFDSAMKGMQREMAALREGILMLQEKQHDAEYSLARLAKTYSILENDIQVKVQSLHVDSERCGALRRKIHIEPCIGVTFAMPRCEYDCYRPAQC